MSCRGGAVRIQVRGARVRFGRVHALAGTDLDVDPGLSLGIVGRNGAGKSTLLRAIVGLQPLDRGSVEIIDGADGVPLRGSALRRAIGFVPDQLSAWDWMRVGELLGFLRRVQPDFDPAFAAELMESLRLDPGARIRSLSRGTSARVAFVIGLAHRPRLLVLDEPMLGVDAPSHDAILSVLAAYRTDQPCTMVHSSHQIGDLARLVDRIAFLDAGRIVESAEVDEIVDGARRLVVRPAPPSAVALPEEAFVLESRADALVLGVRRGAEAMVDALRPLVPGSTISMLPLSLHDACVDRLRMLEVTR